MTFFTIKEGIHRFKPYLRFKWSKPVVTFSAKFYSNCLYDLGNVDQYDINKLYGVTSIFIHKNSARIGWRAEGKVIRIFAYWYSRGERGFKDMGTVLPEKEHVYSVMVDKNNYIFKMDNTQVIIPGIRGWWSWLTFRAFPFFGGNQKAPHFMSIKLEEKRLH